MKNYYPALFALLLLLSVHLYTDSFKFEAAQEEKSVAKIWSTKKTKIKSGKDAYMKPDGYIEYFNSITKSIDESSSLYKPGYQFQELKKSLTNKALARSQSLPAEFESRGPGNVGGRTRAIAVDPDDDSNCTWFAGAASGGIWKTTDCGDSWVNISPDLPNLSTNSIAQSQSSPNVIYVGTGEVFAGNSTFVRGNGIYKSTDRGLTWELLPSTISNVDYLSVNRIAVDPKDDQVVVIATNTGVFKSTDGGASWSKTYVAPAGGSVQDLQVDPFNFSIQYAGVNSLGIIKSTDAGNTWNVSSTGISEGVRFEIGVAPSNSEIIYTSTFSGENSLLYLSEDSGENWVLVDDPDYDTNFLGAQGWYDNTIAVNPYDPYEVFVGGVSVGKFTVDPSNIGETPRQFNGVDFEESTLFELVSFEADFNGGSLDIASGTDSPSQNPVTVEIRFGEGVQQMAHRYTVPNGETSGVPISDYIYQDYVEVPFEIWDTENDRQLMVSFRDQENDGEFNLNKRSQTDDQLSSAREYIYIHDVEYDAAEADENIAQDGAIEYANMYFFWPVLAESASWNPTALVNSVMRINFGSKFVAMADATAVYDAYGDYEGQNTNNLHPDHHHLTLIKTDEASKTFMIVNGNDGGLGISTNNGERIDQITNGYVTSQFYGADKKPGEEKYIGGMQDNGTWVSTGISVDESNNYNAVIGGDGFEVIWHSQDPEKVIGGYQFNGIQRSINGGRNFTNATTGITDGPFITRLAGSYSSPDVIYAIGPNGVYKSNNFGGSWNMKVIPDETWGGLASASDVEVSLANDRIVWAGAGMANGVFNLFVSKDAGETYEAVNNYSPDPRANYTGIYTHPKEENTAYALFGKPNFPKVLKTTDLGQTWEDISGFEGNENGSSRGFPDVIAHSLLVMPFDTDIIWVGTEIGIYESMDGGQSWNIRSDFPSVSVWSMKIVDDEIVIGTHGRGIWTATLEPLFNSNIKLAAFNYEGYGNAKMTFDFPVEYEEVQLMINNEQVESLTNANAGETTFELSGFHEFAGARAKIVSTLNGEVIESRNFNTPNLELGPVIVSQESFGANGDYKVKLVLENNEPFDKIEVLFNNTLVFTDEQQLSVEDENRIIQFDYSEVDKNSLEIKGYIKDTVFSTLGQTTLVTSAPDASNELIKIYPNPTSDILNITNPRGSIHNITIYNSNGQLVQKHALTDDSNVISLKSLEAGVYLLQLQDDEGKLLTKRIIKE